MEAAVEKKSEKSEKVTVTITLTRELKERAEQAARARNMYLSQFIRLVLEEYLNGQRSGQPSAAGQGGAVVPKIVQLEKPDPLMAIELEDLRDKLKRLAKRVEELELAVKPLMGSRPPQQGRRTLSSGELRLYYRAKDLHSRLWKMLEWYHNIVTRCEYVQIYHDYEVERMLANLLRTLRTILDIFEG
ncbi:MAG: CopG family transcriptional regulator [Thermofilaceae archaeon]